MDLHPRPGIPPADPCPHRELRRGLGVYANEDGIPLELSLDHPFAGLGVVSIVPTAGTTTDQLRAWLEAELVPGLLAGGQVESVSSWTVWHRPPAPAGPGRGRLGAFAGHRRREPGPPGPAGLLERVARGPVAPVRRTRRPSTPGAGGPWCSPPRSSRPWSGRTPTPTSSGDPTGPGPPGRSGQAPVGGARTRATDRAISMSSRACTTTTAGPRPGGETRPSRPRPSLAPAPRPGRGRPARRTRRPGAGRLPSPTPPVNTRPSRPPRAAVMARHRRPEPVHVDAVGEGGRRVAARRRRPPGPRRSPPSPRQAGQARCRARGRPRPRRGQGRRGACPQDGPGVDGPGPGGHDQALQRGEAHGGVDRAAAGHRGQRGPGAEMGGDQPEPLAGAAEQLGRPAAGPGVAEAVEAVAADAASSAPLPPGRRRWRPRGAWSAWKAVSKQATWGRSGRRAASASIAARAWRVVQRGQLGQRGQVVVDVPASSSDRRGEGRSPVDHPVAGGVDGRDAAARKAASAEASPPPLGAAQVAGRHQRRRRSSTRSFTLLEPALTTRTRTAPPCQTRRRRPGGRPRTAPPDAPSDRSDP